MPFETTPLPFLCGGILLPAATYTVTEYLSEWIYVLLSCVIFSLFRESVCTIFVIGLINSLSRYFLSSCMLYFIYYFLFNNSDDLTDCKICMRKA